MGQPVHSFQAYQMIEAMADGGVKMGLPRDVAQKFAAQTLMVRAEFFYLFFFTCSCNSKPPTVYSDLATPHILNLRLPFAQGS